MYRQLAEILVQCLGCASLTAKLVQAEKGEVFIRRRAPEGTGSQGYANTCRFEHMLVIVTSSSAKASGTAQLSDCMLISLLMAADVDLLTL